MLPLADQYKRIAVIGPNANSKGYVPTHYGPRGFDNFISVYEGLKKFTRKTKI